MLLKQKEALFLFFMKKYIVIIILILSGTVYSKNLQIEVDGAVFNGFNNSTIWELYYSFPDSILTYVPKDSNYIGELHFNVIIKNNLKTIDSTSWIVEDFSKYPFGKEKHFLFGTKRFFLPNGQFTALIEVKDLNNTKSVAKTKFNILAREFPNKKVNMSDIQLSNHIESLDTSKVNWNKSITKNGLVVLPNPSLEIVGIEPFLNLYYEIYNTKTVSPEGFQVNYIIYNSVKDEVLNLPMKYESINDALVKTISIPLNVFPSGVYFIKVQAKYTENRIKDSIFTLKKFFIINPDLPPQQIANYGEGELFARSEFSTFSKEQINDELLKIKYIASSYERELFDKLETKEAKQRFLFSFWRKRAKDTTSTYNDVYEEFKDKIKFCNTYFSYGKNREGWKTDRGRILLKYGHPTQRDYVAPNADSRAYETWFYQEIQGGVYFYFVDMAGFNNFSLVHSTAIGENYNDNWYDEYVPTLNMDANQKRIDRLKN
jgi:GWxTD domain-containing protein